MFILNNSVSRINPHNSKIEKRFGSEKTILLSKSTPILPSTRCKVPQIAPEEDALSA
jgi:hypothetical protein